MNNICVAYLLRKNNSPTHFTCFLNSYKKNIPGIDHDLLIIYKGFKDKLETLQFEKELFNIKHDFIFFDDYGFDLTPYLFIANKFNYEYFCFFNSFSEINSENWLLNFYKAINRESVGIVGASGSSGSIVPRIKTYRKDMPFFKKLVRPLVVPFIRALRKNSFKEFPKFHIRTNAFMAKKEVLQKIKFGTLKSKLDAYKLESGLNGITRQIELMGLRPLIVTKDGSVFEKNDWQASCTFWTKNQANLMVTDNQTRKYDVAKAHEKKSLELFAWGKNL
jgi:hypothetical protein